MKILHIMPRLPYPPDDGGKIVLYNTYKYFSELGCKVDLFSYYYNDEISNIKEKLEEFGNVNLINKNTTNSLTNIVKYSLLNKPLYVYKYINNNILNQLENLYLKNKYDIIHFEHSATAQLSLFLKNKYNVIIGHRMHNIEWKIWERYALELSNFSIKRKMMLHQMTLLKSFENLLYNKCDVNFSVTDTDKNYALKYSPKANIVTSSIGVDPERWIVKDLKRNTNELIIATTYKWIHNINGLKWFIEKVLPKVQAIIPDVKLTLLGKNVPDYFKHHPNKAINPVGYVDSVSEYLNKASVYVAPLFVGSGIRVKILEAMAMELPVVATRISAEGIKDEDQKIDNGLFVSDNPAVQAKTIINLLQNNKLRDSEGSKAKDFVYKNFDWKSNINIMINNYEKLLNDKKN